MPRRVSEGIETLEKLKGQIVDVLGSQPDPIPFHAIGRLTGARLDRVWLAARSLEVDGQIVIDIIQGAQALSISPAAIKARRSQRRARWEAHQRECRRA